LSGAKGDCRYQRAQFRLCVAQNSHSPEGAMLFRATRGSSRGGARTARPCPNIPTGNEWAVLEPPLRITLGGYRTDSLSKEERTCRKP
jgi:hypothetical protein